MSDMILQAGLEKNALTTLGTMLTFLGLSEQENADIRNTVIWLINSASAYIERMTDRSFGRQDYVESHQAGGGQELCLRHYPVVAVAEIRDTSTGYLFPPESYDFEQGKRLGTVYRDTGWAERGYRGGLAYDISLRSRYIRVAYTAGYILPKDATKEQPSDLPYDLQMVVWQMVQQQWILAKSGALGLSAFSISDVSWTFDKTLGTQVQDIIQRYMRWA